jgi:hypothetical protein
MTQDLVITLDYANATKVHPMGLAALAIAVTGVLTVQRRYVPAVFVGLAALIPSAQRVVVGGLDFNFIRILVLAGMLRAMVRNDFSGVRWCAVDACVLAGMVLKIVGVVARVGMGPDFTSTLGAEFEAIGAYVLFRSALRSPADLRAVLMSAAWVTLVAMPFFLVERATGKNLFSAFGGVPAETVVREGRLRCQGAIAHAILAGCFFAAFVPMWIGIAIRSKGVRATLVWGASVAAIVIVICSASSTPVAAIGQGIIAWLLFRVRLQLRVVWISVILMLFMLHMVMKQPVWHLIGRLDFVGGSTGYHRFLLIDESINHIADWWAFGVRSTEYWGEGLGDVTNQFVLDGVRGGLGATLALVLAFVLVFGYCGRAIRASTREISRTGCASCAEPREMEALAYGIGAALFVHIGIFTAVSYFGQTIAIWQFVLAAGASVAAWPAMARDRPGAPARSRRTSVGRADAGTRPGGAAELQAAPVSSTFSGEAADISQRRPTP